MQKTTKVPTGWCCCHITSSCLEVWTHKSWPLKRAWLVMESWMVTLKKLGDVHLDLFFVDDVLRILPWDLSHHHVGKHVSAFQPAFAANLSTTHGGWWFPPSPSEVGVIHHHPWNNHLQEWICRSWGWEDGRMRGGSYGFKFKILGKQLLALWEKRVFGIILSSQSKNQLFIKLPILATKKHIFHDS